MSKEQIPQLLYHNLERDTFEFFTTDLEPHNGLEYLGDIRMILERLKNLEETNKALEFMLRQKEVS